VLVYVRAHCDRCRATADDCTTYYTMYPVVDNDITTTLTIREDGDYVQVEKLIYLEKCHKTSLIGQLFRRRASYCSHTLVRLWFIFYTDQNVPFSRIGTTLIYTVRSLQSFARQFTASFYATGPREKCGFMSACHAT
jgi:hypothetical protein